MNDSNSAATLSVRRPSTPRRPFSFLRPIKNVSGIDRRLNDWKAAVKLDRINTEAISGSWATPNICPIVPCANACIARTRLIVPSDASHSGCPVALLKVNRAACSMKERSLAVRVGSAFFASSFSLLIADLNPMLAFPKTASRPFLVSTAPITRWAYWVVTPIRSRFIKVSIWISSPSLPTDPR